MLSLISAYNLVTSDYHGVIITVSPTIFEKTRSDASRRKLHLTTHVRNAKVARNLRIRIFPCALGQVYRRQEGI